VNLLKKNSILKKFVFILVAGMGNVKQNNMSGILIYFLFIVLLGVGFFFAEQRLLEQYFHPSQTMRTFAVLMYIAFAFFWDGSVFISNEKNNNFFGK